MKESTNGMLILLQATILVSVAAREKMQYVLQGLPVAVAPGTPGERRASVTMQKDINFIFQSANDFKQE